MKTVYLLVLSTSLTAYASVVQFEISPSGTDVAVGLSPSNEVPAVVSSTGSGNAISCGVLFDMDTSILQLALGYGSAAGFTDLTGAATAMHIHGPAAPGQSADVLVDLTPYSFPSTDATKGGVIYANVAFPASAVSNLLAGFCYVNIHTAANPNGEIRGQLVATSSGPSVTCPADFSVECPAPANLTVAVSHPQGDALTVVWSVNGTSAQTNSVPAGAPGASANVSFSSTLPLGTNVISVTVTDTANNTASCATLVTVVDTVPPVIVSVSATPNCLWPPNHFMIPIKLCVKATDACGPVSWKILGVTSNEAVNGKGDGNTCPDWQIVNDHCLKLRSERSGKGSGRVYTITVQASDEAGNLSDTKTVTVTVPKSQGKGKGK